MIARMASDELSRGIVVCAHAGEADLCNMLSQPASEQRSQPEDTHALTFAHDAVQRLRSAHRVMPPIPTGAAGGWP